MFLKAKKPFFINIYIVLLSEDRRDNIILAIRKDNKILKKQGSK